MPDYDSPGKQSSRVIFTDVFATEGGTVLDFFGNGRSAEQFVSAGLTVTSAEKSQELWPNLERHSAEWGYEPFYGNAVKIKRRFDYVNADFCNNAGTPSRKVLRRLAPFVDKWLAVTVSTDHQINHELQGASATATVPVWMIEATDMNLHYVGRYVRNEKGQTMWIALLTPRDPAARGHQHIAPLTTSREIRRRGYWATPYFRNRFPQLVQHRSNSMTDHAKTRWRERYLANREAILEAERERYHANRERRRANHKLWREANPKAYEEAQVRWRAMNPDYQQSEKIRAYKHEWYMKNRERMIENERQRKLKLKEAA